MSDPNTVVIQQGESTTEVVPSVSIENMLNQRAAALERYSQAVELLHQASQLTPAAHLGEVRIDIKVPTGNHRSILEAEGMTLIRQELDRGGWRYLMNESGLRTFMDATARRAWDEQLHKGTVPELTRDNVEATFRSMHATREDMFDRGVIECFKRLSWDYKTNQPFKFGHRIILSYLFSVYGNGTTRSLHLRHEICDELDDLVRVFCVLDGKPEPDHRRGMWSAISGAHHEGKVAWEGDYFHLRWFLKGSGHVTFKRPELVDRLNVILAKHFPGALPAPRS